MSPPAREPVVRLDHATLLAAIAPGEGADARAARREACRRVAAQVYRVVAAVLGPASADVGDASQEALIRVVRAVPSFVHDPARPAAPTAWVNQIALRAALDRVKERKRRVEREHEIDLGDAASDDDLEATLDRRDLVRALLERLDEKERAVLVLKYWNGETDEEIAATLGIPLGTVKTRLRAAGDKLRRGARVQAEALLVAAAVEAKA